jgi:hypothetical protein
MISLEGVMQFKDAAYEILKEASEPLHYNTITELALKDRIITTSGLTPHQSMGALLYTDTLKPNSRFRRGDIKGTFALREAQPSDIQAQINAIDAKVRKTLVTILLKMAPRKFESLIQSLLDEMGIEDSVVTQYSGDGGIDVRGELNAENLSHINVAVQAKRWKHNVGAKIVRELRGSLKVHEHGIIITPSNFTAAAIKEADESGKAHISLINGSALVDLLIQHQVGVKQEEYIIPVIDEEYWSEVLGEAVESAGMSPSRGTEKPKPKSTIDFPISIQGTYRDTVYKGELLDREGTVRYQGKLYKTVSAAAKAITVDWKSVNGWNFWRFYDVTNQKWRIIKQLKD